MTRIVVLGGGPAGAGAAFRLAKSGKARVVLIERGAGFGGNAGSFAWNGHRLDYGSHRLHPSSAPAILADIRALLGPDLLDLPRHGRIRLLGRWVHFPLKPADLLLHLHPAFAAGALVDAAAKLWPRGRRDGPENFASVLERGLGKTICRHFYFPYARKIWGLEPELLSANQARKRVAAGSLGKLARKVLASVPGFKPKGSGRFFYPRDGFGQITGAFADAARGLGAELRLDTTVTGLDKPATEGQPWRVHVASAGKDEILEADHVWSTLPIPLVLRMLRPQPAPEVLAATAGISYRSMLLVYLDLGIPQFTPFDAHYFPETAVTITRLSEPKNYAVRSEPAGRTVLCAELPCARGDRHWSMSDRELGELVTSDLERSGLGRPSPLLAVTTRRLPEAYPLYPKGYEAPLAILDREAEALPRFLTFGRQGLFAHDNTHHALAMAYAAVDCLDHGTFDRAQWAAHRATFARHVVED